MQDFKNKGFATNAIHGNWHDEQFGSLTFPIHQTSTTVFANAVQGGNRFAGQESGFIYSRLGNPSTAYLESKLARLEGCDAALVLSSGMGAIATVFLTALKSGDHVICDEVVYGCTHSLLQHQLEKFNITCTFVDTTCEEELNGAIKENTKMIYVETPANPTLKIVDLEKIVAFAKKHNLISVVDNTVATPYITRPKEYGIDVIVHSVTKYLNGHGDVIAGAICGDLEFLTACRLEGQKDMTGSVMSAFDAFLINRGLKTLEIRMDRHSENAQKVAEFLDAHPNVDQVYYPGLATHCNHEIAVKQMNGKFSGLLAFEVKGGKEAAQKVADGVQLISLAVSLGDAESLIQHPATMTHSTYSPEDLEKAGIPANLLRMSVGLECVDDIIADLKEQLDNL